MRALRHCSKEDDFWKQTWKNIKYKLVHNSQIGFREEGRARGGGRGGRKVVSIRDCTVTGRGQKGNTKIEIS